tara:strand:+ start:334 stop:666 length:333 start_codon:yes stop_codon:yes gene_type:complete
MKKTLKYLVKLLFVIVLPVAVSISAITLVITNWDTTSLLVIIGLAIITVLTIFNAVFYSVVLSNTKLLPEISFETGLVLGFCIAYDTNSFNPTITIVIPFIIMEIKPKNK